MSRFTILTVCTGNVHRSPLAAVLLERWASWYLPAEVAADVTVGSAGTHAPVGARAGDRVATIASRLGADATAHRAQRLTDELVSRADLVLAASRAHRDDVLARVPSALRRTFTIREAGRAAEALTTRSRATSIDDLRAAVAALAEHRGVAADARDDDVIDPQGLDSDAYARMVQEQVPPLAALGAVLFGMPPGDLAEYRRAASDPVLLFAGDGAAGRS